MNLNIVAFLGTFVSISRPDKHVRRQGKQFVSIPEPVTDDLIASHLAKKLSISVYNLIGAKTQIGVIDLDDHDNSASWEIVRSEVLRLQAALAQRGFKSFVVRSGGGRGAHIWISFEKPQPAKVVRSLLRACIKECRLSVGTKGISARQVEVFPKSDDAGEGLGSAIALPFGRKSVPLDADGNPIEDWTDWRMPDRSEILNSDISGYDEDSQGRAAPSRKRGQPTIPLVTEMLACIPSDDHDVWIRSGMILKHEFGDEGYDIWDVWSQKSDKYPGNVKTSKIWRGLKPDGRVAFGSLCKMATKHGWQPPKQVEQQAIVASINAKYGILAAGMKPVVIVKHRSNDEEDDTVFELIGFEVFKARMNRKPKIEVQKGNRTVLMNRGEWWLEQEQASQYLRLIFDPSLPPGDNGDSWNIWLGFAFDPSPGDWSLFKNHILENICNGNRDLYDWLLNWMALGVQEPGEVIGTAPVFKGEPGTGKTIWAELYGRSFGRHYLAVTDRTQTTGHFNGHMQGRRLILMDEAFFVGDRRDMGVIKTRVTQKKQMIERKGIDAISVANHAIFAVATNEASAAPADAADRRWTVFKVANYRKDDRAYFVKIKEQMETGGYAAMLHELLSRDISKGPDPRITIKTRDLVDDWLAHTDREVRFIWELLNSGVLPHSHPVNAHKTTIEQLWEALKRQNGSYAHASQSKLSRVILEVLPGVTKTQDRMNHLIGITRTRSKVYSFPPLVECRREFEEFSGFKFAWDSEVTEWSSDYEIISDVL